MVRRIIALFICFSLIVEQAGFAQVAPAPVIPAYLQALAPVADKFRPVHVRSIGFSTADTVDLLLDKGDSRDLDAVAIQTTAQELYRYFKIGLALPNELFWVNLRPDSPDNVIDPWLEKTDVGRILLEADLQLKKDLARFTDPASADGRQYWNALYEKAERVFGPEDMTIPTFTRPWIVPGEIIIRESPAGAFIYKATLKVMLEQDYLKDTAFYNFDDPRVKEINQYSSELIRHTIIPRLTREVNGSRRYAKLRQVYYSLILAQWYKRSSVIARSDAMKQSSLFPVDTRDLSGLTARSAWSKDTYYNAYKRSFSEGEYNRQEQVAASNGITIRQYFSGGIGIVSTHPHADNVVAAGTDNFVGDPDPSLVPVSVNLDGARGRITVDISGQQNAGEPAVFKEKLSTMALITGFILFLGTVMAGSAHIDVRALAGIGIAASVVLVFSGYLCVTGKETGNDQPASRSAAFASVPLVKEISRTVFQAASELTGDPRFNTYFVTTNADQSAYSVEGDLVNIDLENMVGKEDDEIAAIVGHEAAHGYLNNHKRGRPSLSVFVSQLLLSMCSIYMVLPVTVALVDINIVWAALSVYIPGLTLGGYTVTYRSRIEEAKCDLIDVVFTRAAGYRGDALITNLAGLSRKEIRYQYAAFAVILPVLSTTHPSHNARIQNIRAFTEFLDTHQDIDPRKLITQIRDLDWLSIIFFRTRGIKKLSGDSRVQIEPGHSDAAMDGGRAEEAKRLYKKAQGHITDNQLLKALDLLAQARELYAGISDEDELKCELKIIQLKIMLDRPRDAYEDLQVIVQRAENVFDLPERWQGHIAILLETLSDRLYNDKRYWEAAFLRERLAEYKFVTDEEGAAGLIWESVANSYRNDLNQGSRAWWALFKAMRAFKDADDDVGRMRCKNAINSMMPPDTGAPAAAKPASSPLRTQPFPTVSDVATITRKDPPAPAQVPDLTVSAEQPRTFRDLLPEELRQEAYIAAAEKLAVIRDETNKISKKKALIAVNENEEIVLTPKGAQALRNLGTSVPEILGIEAAGRGRPFSLLTEEDKVVLNAVLAQMTSRHKQPVYVRLLEKKFITVNVAGYQLTTKGIRGLMRRSKKKLPATLTLLVTDLRGRSPALEDDELVFLETLIPQEQAEIDQSAEAAASVTLEELSAAFQAKQTEKIAKQLEKKAKDTIAFFERKGRFYTDPLPDENTPEFRKIQQTIRFILQYRKDKNKKQADVYDLSIAVFETTSQWIGKQDIGDLVNELLQDPANAELIPYYISREEEAAEEDANQEKEEIDLWFLPNAETLSRNTRDGGENALLEEYSEAFRAHLIPDAWAVGESFFAYDVLPEELSAAEAASAAVKIRSKKEALVKEVGDLLEEAYKPLEQLPGQLSGAYEAFDPLRAKQNLEAWSLKDLLVAKEEFSNVRLQSALEDHDAPSGILGSRVAHLLAMSLFSVALFSAIAVPLASAANPALHGGSDWTAQVDVFSLGTGNGIGPAAHQPDVSEITQEADTRKIASAARFDAEIQEEMTRQATLAAEREALHAEKPQEDSVLQSMLPDDASVKKSVIDVLEEDNPEVAAYLQENNVTISCELSTGPVARAWVSSSRPTGTGEEQPVHIVIYTHPSRYSPSDSAAATVRAVERFVKDKTDDSLLLYELTEDPAYKQGGAEGNSRIDPFVAGVLFPQDPSDYSPAARFALASGAEIRLGQTSLPDMRSEIIGDRGKEALIINETMARSLGKNDPNELQMFVEEEVRHYLVEKKLGGIKEFWKFDLAHRDTSMTLPPEDAALVYADYIKNRPVILERYSDPEVQETVLWLQVAQRKDMNKIIEQNVPIQEWDFKYYLFPSFVGGYSPGLWGGGSVSFNPNVKNNDLGQTMPHELRHALDSKDKTGNPVSYWLGAHENLILGGADQMEREAYPYGELNNRIISAMQDTGKDVYYLSPQDIEELVAIRNSMAAESWSYGRKVLYDQSIEEILAESYRMPHAVGAGAVLFTDILMVDVFVRRVRQSLRTGILGNLTRLLRKAEESDVDTGASDIPGDAPSEQIQQDAAQRDGGNEGAGSDGDVSIPYDNEVAMAKEFLAVKGYSDQQIAGWLARGRSKLLEIAEAAGFSLDGGNNADQSRAGGIDFRSLPAAGQSQQMPSILPQLQELAAHSQMTDLNKEWADIQKTIRTSDMPYQKIKEYIAVCSSKQDNRAHLCQVAACLMNILKLEEEQALPTRAELRELLLYLG